MDGKQAHQLEGLGKEGLAGLLKRFQRGLGPALISADLQLDLTDEALKRRTTKQQLRGLLVASDLTNGDGARTEASLLRRSTLLVGVLTPRVDG